ncbi:Centromere protein S [Mactra antiquata]
MSTAEEFEKLSENQRLKAAVHHTTLQICKEHSASQDVQLNRMVVASISETVWRKFEAWATDLELFAKHAKRSTINADDVKMLIRKSPKLLAHMNQVHEQIVATKNEGKKKTKKSTAKD